MALTDYGATLPRYCAPLVGTAVALAVLMVTKYQSGAAVFMDIIIHPAGEQNKGELPGVYSYPSVSAVRLSGRVTLSTNI